MLGGGGRSEAPLGGVGGADGCTAVDGGFIERSKTSSGLYWLVSCTALGCAFIDISITLSGLYWLAVSGSNACVLDTSALLTGQLNT